MTQACDGVQNPSDNVGTHPGKNGDEGDEGEGGAREVV